MSLMLLLCVAVGMLLTGSLTPFIGTSRRDPTLQSFRCGRPPPSRSESSFFERKLHPKAPRQQSLLEEFGDNMCPEFETEDELGQLFVQQWTNTTWGQSHALVGGFEAVRVMSGVVDLLAVHKYRSELLVLELKRGRATHRTLGQLLRYLGDIKMLWPEFAVCGAVVAGCASDSLKLALAAAPWVEFYTFRVAESLLESILEVPNSVVPLSCVPQLQASPCHPLWGLVWQGSTWSTTHDLMTARRLSSTRHQLIGRQKHGQRGEIVIVHVDETEKKQSFPALSHLLHEMGRHIASGCSFVRGALVVREATPRLLYAAQASEIEVWETLHSSASSSSNWRRARCRKRKTRGQLLTTLELAMLRKQIVPDPLAD